MPHPASDTAAHPLTRHIERYVQLTPNEREQLFAVARAVRVRRRQLITQPGAICRHRTYILEGAFRVFHVDDQGKELTVKFGVEDWWVSDFYSYVYQEPAEHYIEALEDARVLQFEYHDIEPLISGSLALSEYFRLTTERAFAHARRRVISQNRDTAEQRYDAFLRKYPQVASRLPQYVLASYLGMTPEFLSRVRKRRASGS